MTVSKDKEADNLYSNNISEIVVLPPLETLEEKNEDLNECFENFLNFLELKTAEYQQNIRETSIVSFTVNWIQSRIVNTEFGTHLAKLYEVFEVQKMEDFDAKIKQLLIGGSEKTIELIKKMKQLLSDWENFLIDIDKQLDKIVGPEKAPDLNSSGEIHLVSQNKMFRSGTLLSYLKKSAFDLMLLEIVASFSVRECYEHVKRMFENLAEFQKLNCDILLLTKRPTQGGSGFLKLIGIPFRILLSEKESLKQLLSHRQSVVLLAGLRAIHSYAEFVCSDHNLENEKDNENNAKNSDIENSPEMRSLLGSESGCALVDRKGQIVFCHVCKNNTDWPNVEKILEIVKENQLSISTKTLTDPNDKSANNKNQKNSKTALTTTSNDTGTPTSDISEQTVTVYKRKCCTIL